MTKKTRAPLLSARVNWIVVEILIVFAATVIYTIIVWIDESSKVGQTRLETFKAVVSAVVPFSQFMLFYVIGIFELGGEIMIRFTHKIQKALEQGIEQGKSEIYRAWYADWERRKQAAAEKGIPFDDPPPPNPDNNVNQE